MGISFHGFRRYLYAIIGSNPMDSKHFIGRMEHMEFNTLPADGKTFHKVVHINASPSRVWQTLTILEQMNAWMMPDVKLDILTDWNVGAPIIMRGHMNGKDFENRGTVLIFEPETTLRYTHLSSISRLPDRPENYTVIDFRLTPAGDQTSLEHTSFNFPNESIYKHFAFYWNVTLEVLKRLIEQR
jgi:uncharacterized protein YndB with AHSA1/START domain